MLGRRSPTLLPPRRASISAIRKAAAGACLGALLAGCGTPPGIAEVPILPSADPAARTCPADVWRDRLLGRPIDTVVVEALPRPLRTYQHGTIITMDYRPDRMNVVFAAAGGIVRVYCG